MKNVFLIHWLSYLTIAMVCLSCDSQESVQPVYYPNLMEIPTGFPVINFPEDNAFSYSRWELGKQLFFDPILSKDTSISCASCHQPDLAFSDQINFSQGVDQRLGTRNSPTLTNVAYHPYFTREGGVPTLEMQVLVPVQEHNEFDFNIVLIANRLQEDSLYTKMAQEAYNRVPDAFVITRALATFERSLLSGNSPYDQYMYQENKAALSSNEINGMDLFFSDKTKCSSCHQGFNFTNYTFKNNGLYQQYPDAGRFILTGNEMDRALFKVPSLRNVSITAPYMHDGSIGSLEAVLEHYQAGGKNHPHKSNLIRPFDLTENEKQDLLAFLGSLTDQSFIENPLFSN